MAIPEHWYDFLFPDLLRPGGEGEHWLHPFGRTRRVYVLGYMDAATQLGRVKIDMVIAGLSPQFREDPRRGTPFSWRRRFVPHGETFTNGNYAAPPPERRHADCTVWAAFGKDQPEHACLARVMRATDAVKALAALYDAEKQLGRSGVVQPSADGLKHPPGHISFHPALFTVDGFTIAYFDTHFKNDPVARRAFAHAAGLIPEFRGLEVPTLYELANGLCVTYRTAQALIDFVADKGFPPIGPIRFNRALRGTDRDGRQIIKGKRPGYLKNNTADCAIELFV